jgi:hypothetical protein
VERRRTLSDMKKRILAAFLWFYAGWYLGAIIAEFVHISPLFGPLLGAVAAALVAGDPRHIIWKAKTAVDASTATQTASPEGA